jgi:hypothetical protein
MPLRVKGVISQKMVLDKLQSLFRGPDASPPKPFTGNVTENRHDATDSFHVAEQVQENVNAAVCAGDMEVFSVAYVSGFNARQLLRGVDCDARKTCVISQVISTNVFIYFKE